MLHNYNVPLWPLKNIKFHLVVTELHGNEFFSKFAQIFPWNNGFYAIEVINVQMNHTIFILSAQLKYVQSFMSKLLCLSELERLIRRRRRRKIMSKNNSPTRSIIRPKICQVLWMSLPRSGSYDDRLCFTKMGIVPKRVDGLLWNKDYFSFRKISYYIMWKPI
jgi:hypothetical protein